MSKKKMTVDKLTIRDINNQIRDFINESTIKKTDVLSRKQDGYWTQLFVALDTIDDTGLAMENLGQDSKKSFLKNPYLLTYGFLQAMVVQQDAVNYLKISLFGSSHKIKWSDKMYAGLKEIRSIRNETIGHPVKTEKRIGKSKYSDDEVSSCTIDRSSLSNTGFRYLLWKHSRTEKKSIQFSEIMRQQEKYLGAELKFVMKKLESEEKKHKAKFKGKKLDNLLNAKSLYTINLIYGAGRGDHLAWPSFDYYQKQYKKVRQGLEARYGTFDISVRISGTKLVIEKLDYIFSKIEMFKTSGKFDDIELEVYVDGLDASLDELREHLKEIDKEFGS